jgi:hypothetical protein
MSTPAPTPPSCRTARPSQAAATRGAADGCARGRKAPGTAAPDARFGTCLRHPRDIPGNSERGDRDGSQQPRPFSSFRPRPRHRKNRLRTLKSLRTAATGPSATWSDETMLHGVQKVTASIWADVLAIATAITSRSGKATGCQDALTRSPTCTAKPTCASGSLSCCPCTFRRRSSRAATGQPRRAPAALAARAFVTPRAAAATAGAIWSSRARPTGLVTDRAATTC